MEEKEDMANKIMEARTALDRLSGLNIFKQHEFSEHFAFLDKLEKDNFVFITKPFRRYEAAEKYMYDLMRSRSRAFMEKMNELEQNKHDQVCDK